MSRFDEQYLELCQKILTTGEKITTDPKVLKQKTDQNILLSMTAEVILLKYH